MWKLLSLFPVSAEIPIPGIRNLHSFTHLNGGILASQLSCLQCKVGENCASCKTAPLTVSLEEVKAALDSQQDAAEESDDTDLEVEDEESESEDDVGSDVQDEESEKDESEDEASRSSPGSVVWVLWGRRWYPAVIVSVSEVPNDILNKLRREDGRSVVVRFYGEDTYSRVDIKNIDELGSTALDLKRSRFTGIIEKYHLALADLKYKD